MTQQEKQLAAFELTKWIRDRHPELTVDETFELLDLVEAGIRNALREMTALASAKATGRRPQ